MTKCSNGLFSKTGPSGCPSVPKGSYYKCPSGLYSSSGPSGCPSHAIENPGDLTIP